jgi:hypothetical protein
MNKYELDRQATIEKLIAVPGAKKAFDSLVKKNADPDKLMEAVLMAAHAYKLPKSYDYYAVIGMTRSQVNDLPDRLRQAARWVELVEDNPYLEAEPPLSVFAGELPASLRRYARHVESTVKFGRDFMKKNPRYTDLVTVFKRKLLRYVNQSTGAPHFSAVSNLLNAALLANGRDDSVEPSALRKLHSRSAELSIGKLRK